MNNSTFKRKAYVRPPAPPPCPVRAVAPTVFTDLVAQPKTEQHRNRRLLDLARGMPCLLRVPGVCQGGTETTVAAHSNWAIHGKAGAPVIAIISIARNVAMMRENNHSSGKIGEPAKQWNAMRALSNSSLLRNDSMPDSILLPACARWFELRFIESPKKVRCDCQVCMRPMWFPPSKAGKYLTCGGDCAEKRRASLMNVRRRNCLTCAAEFIPRTTQLAIGGGKYCCVACAEPAREAGRTPEVAAKRGLSRRAAFAAGLYVPARGEKSHSWKGGRQAHLQRRKESGAQRESTRKYRRENPEKVREFTKKRRGLMTGALPRGTVKRIGELQRWKCAVCRVDIRNRFHTDHVQPLARGGLHVALNIQLLCPTCNTRKSAKDPVAFMQEQGFLL